MRQISTIVTTTCLIALPAFAMADDRGARMFDRIDANADGQLTTAEMTTHKTAMFTTADTDADGMLDAAEREALRERGRRQAGVPGDTDGDGNLSLAEFTARNPLFDRADANADGMVTRAEFDAAKPGRHRPQP